LHFLICCFWGAIAAGILVGEFKKERKYRGAAPPLTLRQ